MKKVILSPVFFTAIFFLLLEAGCSWWLSRYGNAVDRTRPIVGAHASLGWVQFPNFSGEFLGKSFTTDERGFRITPSSHGPHVLFLGPSSTVGWGVSNEESYPALLGKNYSITNASQIGYSTFQGLRLFDEVLAGEKFKIVVISYGINDVDMNRFFFQSPRTDAEEFAQKKNEVSVRIQRLIFRSSTLICMQKLVFGTLSRFAPQASSHEVLEKSVRVRGEEFRSNLIALIRKARASGAIPVLLSTSTFFEQKDDPEVNLRQALIQKRMEGHIRILKDVGSAEGVTVADPETWLTGERAKLFVDPVHFSAEGNRLIAEGLRDLFYKLINQGASNG